MASWMATWSEMSILSNSSIAQIPLSASISAPASIVNSPVSSSLTTAAVRPAAEDAFPEVYTARGRNPQTYLCQNILLRGYLRNCDFDVDGSPTIQTLI